MESSDGMFESMLDRSGKGCVRYSNSRKSIRKGGTVVGLGLNSSFNHPYASPYCRKPLARMFGSKGKSRGCAPVANRLRKGLRKYSVLLRSVHRPIRCVSYPPNEILTVRSQPQDRSMSKTVE